MLMRLAGICAAALLFTACGPSQRPTTFWAKPGMTRDSWNMDNASCNVEAAQRVPASYAPMPQPAPQTTVNVLTPSPGIQFSTQPVDPAYMVPVDRNAGVRQDAYRVCMMQRGYRMVSG
jgi:hypothetical protein